MNRILAEAVGTALLLATVVGSGIMGERLANGNAAIALLANSIATGASLYALITMFGRLSGAHFNPVVTLTAWIDRTVTASTAIAYAFAQAAGAVAGVLAAHAMFQLPLIMTSTRGRTGVSQWFSEVIAIVRPHPCHSTHRSVPRRADRGRSRVLHHGRVLVHIVHFVREPCGHRRAFDDRHLLGHQASRCAVVHGRAVDRRAARLDVDATAPLGNGANRPIMMMFNGGHFRAVDGPPVRVQPAPRAVVPGLHARQDCVGTRACADVLQHEP